MKSWMPQVLPLHIRSIVISVFTLQYLNSVRQMEGYGSVVFPHCACDSRKEGRVIPIVSFEGFKLQACKEDGTEEVICIKTWSVPASPFGQQSRDFFIGRPFSEPSDRVPLEQHSAVRLGRRGCYVLLPISEAEQIATMGQNLLESRELGMLLNFIMITMTMNEND